MNIIIIIISVITNARERRGGEVIHMHTNTHLLGYKNLNNILFSTPAWNLN